MLGVSKFLGEGEFERVRSCPSEEGWIVPAKNAAITVFTLVQLPDSMRKPPCLSIPSGQCGRNRFSAPRARYSNAGFQAERQMRGNARRTPLARRAFLSPCRGRRLLPPDKRLLKKPCGAILVGRTLLKFTLPLRGGVVPFFSVADETQGGRESRSSNCSP